MSRSHRLEHSDKNHVCDTRQILGGRVQHVWWCCPQYLVFIAVLLLAVAYVFAIVGVAFYREEYSREDVTALNYPNSFRCVCG